MDTAANPKLEECATRSTGRDRQAQRKDREAAILAAALEDFQVSGLMNSRLEDIAARAGVAKGTLYLYFSSKNELFKAMVRTLVQPIFDRIEQDLATFEGPSEELFRRTLRQILQHFAVEASGRRLMHLMIAEGHRVPELADVYYSEIALRGLTMIRTILQRGIERKEFRPSPALEFPHLVFAPLTLQSSWPLMFGAERTLDAERFFEAQAEFMLAAIRAPTAPDQGSGCTAKNAA